MRKMHFVDFCIHVPEDIHAYYGRGQWRTYRRADGSTCEALKMPDPFRFDAIRYPAGDYLVRDLKGYYRMTAEEVAQCQPL